jgi:hypothetical protein
MKIVDGLPPNIADIEKVFGAVCRKPSVMFCYGDTIYAPGGIVVPPQLIAHEAIHSERQGDSPGDWWHRYLHEIEFRYSEELLAHRAEYAAMLTSPLRKRYLKAIAKRLSGPLYGHANTFEKAKHAIQEGQR